MNIIHSRNALSSIASSMACESGCAGDSEGRRGEASLRGAQSLDVLAAGPQQARRDARLRRQQTTRSLDVDVAVCTVSGDPFFNGTIVGNVVDDGSRPEESPLLRNCSLYNRFDRPQPRRKLQDPSYIEFYKQWRSLENVAESKGERKPPRIAIRSWLLGIFGGVPRGSSASLRRAPPLLDRESAV